MFRLHLCLMEENLRYICAPALSFSQFPRRPGMVPASFILRPFYLVQGDLLGGCFSYSWEYPWQVA